METLPHEIVSMVFDFAGMLSLPRCVSVCWQWHAIVKSSDHWRRLNDARMLMCDYNVGTAIATECIDRQIACVKESALRTHAIVQGVHVRSIPGEANHNVCVSRYTHSRHPTSVTATRPCAGR